MRLLSTMPLTLWNARLCVVPYAGQALISITTLQDLPPHAKAVLCVMVSLMKVHVFPPVTLLLPDYVIPGFSRTCMLDSALSASKCIACCTTVSYGSTCSMF